MELKIRALVIFSFGIIISAGCQTKSVEDTIEASPALTQPDTTISPIENTATPPEPTITPLPNPTDTATEETHLPVSPLIVFEKRAQEFNFNETYQAALGDLDNDGDLDAVFANPQKNASAVWLNNGSGGFADTGQELTQYGHGAGLADFDGDGDLDAFIACHQFIDPSRVYFNDGKGMMTAGEQDFGDSAISANDVNLIDIDGDGDIDVHVVYYSPDGLADKVYLNDGTGLFTDSGLELMEETIAWSDLDNDGDVDYFGKRWDNGYVVQLNDGTGQFTEGWTLKDEQATVGAIALADFDKDGDLDALVANGYRQTGSRPSRLFWNEGGIQGGVEGQFMDSGQVLNGTIGADIAVGDLDNDGDPDIFVSNTDLPNEVWLNDGTGSFIDSGLRMGENSDKSSIPSLGDLDNDGDLDVVVGSFILGAEIWWNMSVELEE